MLERQGVLHPAFVVTLESRVSQRYYRYGYLETYLREVLAGVSTTGFLTSGSRDDGLYGVLQNIPELQSFNQITEGVSVEVWSTTVIIHLRVPDHASVLDPNLVKCLVDRAHLLDTLVQ